MRVYRDWSLEKSPDNSWGCVGDFGWAERFGGEYVSLAPWGQKLGRSFG